MPSGGKGLLVHIPEATVMTCMFNLRAGYYLSPRDKWDTPHVLEHLMFGANKSYPDTLLFNQELEKNGAYANASTDYWDIEYFVECADFEWQRVIELFSISLTEPLLGQDQLLSEIGNVQEELSSNLNNYFRVLSNEVSKHNKLQVLSDEKRLSQLSAITAQDVRKHFAKTHTRENIRFIIGGNFSASKKKALLHSLDQMYKILPKGERFDLPAEKPIGVKRPILVPKPDVEKLHYFIDFFLPQGRFSDKEEDACRLLNRILTGSHSSKIFGTARIQGIAYSVGSFLANSHSFVRWGIDGDVTYSNAEALFGLIGMELKKIAIGDLDEQSIEAAKMQAIGRFQMSSQRVSDLVSGYSDWYFYDNRVEDYSAIPSNIERINKQDILAAAQKVLTQKCWSVGLLGKITDSSANKLYQIIEQTVYN